MSKQYVTTNTIDSACNRDIFSIAVTPTQLLVGSGDSAINIFSTTSPGNPLVQSITCVDKVGVHHIATSRDGLHTASAGFGGHLTTYILSESGEWTEEGKIEDAHPNKFVNIWAIALSGDGQYLAATTFDGKIKVWDLANGRKKITEFETKGSLGMAIDLSRDGRFTASGHDDGGIYVFNNETGKMLYSLPSLIESVRAVSFSPGGSLLAAAGDSRIITLIDVQHGEQVANLSGHSSWILSLDWNDNGEYLLTGAHDGKAKVWSIDKRACVATHSETDKALWGVKWLPKTGKSESFATAGANRSISFYREATSS